jgi:hypothetical protein
VQATRDGIVQAVGKAWLLRTRRQLTGTDRSAELGEIAAGERPLAIQRLPRGGAEAEDVGPLVGGLATELLGSHVRRRADQRPGPRQRGRHRALRLRGLARGIRGVGGLQAREAEVGHPHATVGADQDVVRLEVSVDHAGGVRGGQSPTRGDENLDHRVPAARRRAQPRAQRPALDVLHGDEELVAERSDVVHRDDVGVSEACHRLRLTGESGTQRGRVRRRQRWVDELERHHAVQIRVLRGAHRPHPAGADDAKDPIAADALLGARRCGGFGGGRRIARGARDQRAARRACVEVRLDGTELAIREPSSDNRHHVVFRQAGPHDGATFAHNRDGQDREPGRTIA